jgi:predicted enzyme related to lactoylglutathione lyase
MSERDDYIPGVPCWVDASYKDPESVLPFYRGLFGWEFIPAIETPGERFFIATIRGGSTAGIGELPVDQPPVPAWNTYVAVTSSDEAVAKVQAAGGEVVAPAFDVVDAGRMAILKDPQGAVFCVWQAGRTKGAKVVNEHGAVNFNTLHTPDPEAAKTFYRDVFGWTTLSLAGAEFWTLPGYGDYLETIIPGMRKGAAEMGAAGFEDVVAVLEALKDDEQPHWHVTFAVNDADAAAAEAPKLGGQVLVPPLDAPYVRLTVLADPEGTPFTASQFVAENR